LDDGAASNMATEGSAREDVWVEKYRPKRLEDVAAHKEIVETIGKLTRANRLPHLLLYGPPGTGKTSTVLAVAKEMYGNSYQSMTLELNASDDRGINVVRHQIQEFASTRRIFSTGYKLVILDECDAMTKDAQFALRRIIEKYTRSTRFCLICNYVSRIIPALQSRCTRFRFAPLSPDCVLERLEYVANRESVPVEKDGLEAVCAISRGDMRKALNVLQSTYLAHDKVTEEGVYTCTGNPLPKDIEAIVGFLLNDSIQDAYEKISKLKLAKGLALADLVTELHPWVFRLSIPQTVRMDLVDVLASVEHRLAYGTSEKIQLGDVIAAFTSARRNIIAAAQ